MRSQLDMNQDSDPRLGKPSASSFSIDALCPGRQQLLQLLPDAPEIVDEDAERGTKLHLAWQKEDPTGLDSEDTAIYERGLELVKLAVEQWRSDFEIEKFVEGKREERFFFHSGSGEVSASGQADRHYYSVPEGFVLTLDFKSLYARNVVPVEMNWQARFLSVVVSREYGAQNARFSFLKAMWGKLDTVDYTENDLERAQYSLVQALWESLQPESQRRAGPHCRHCKANTVCPEAKAWCLLPSVVTTTNSVTPKQAALVVENVSLEDCAKIYKTQTSRRNIEDAIKARLKMQTPAMLATLGLQFGEPKILRPITKTQTAFEFLLSLGVPAEKLWNVTSMSNTELDKVIQESLGLASKKEASEWRISKLASCIEAQETERPLEKI